MPIHPTLFGVALRKDIVHEVIRYQRAKVRQPKKTKRVGDFWLEKETTPAERSGPVSGGQQEKLGVARWNESARSVIRDYSFTLNRKVRAMGMMICLSAKLREGNLHV